MDAAEKERLDSLIDVSDGFKWPKCSIWGLSQKSFRSDDSRFIRKHIEKMRNSYLLPKNCETLEELMMFVLLKIMIFYIVSMVAVKL